MMDVTNHAVVAVKGDKLVIMNPPRHAISRHDGLVIAAYIVALADPGGEQFAEILEAVKNT